MGIENNECIIATTWNNEVVEKIKKWIDEEIDPAFDEFKKLFCIIPSVVNNKQTIILAPDGSKKGWETAEKGKIVRDIFIDKIESFNYEDGSNPFDYVEVGYGEFGQTILRGNCSNRYDNSDYYDSSPNA